MQKEARKNQIQWRNIDSFVGNFTSPALTFHRPCPICGSMRARVMMHMNDVQFYTDSDTLPKRVDIIENQCVECFSMYRNPVFSEVGFQILFAQAGMSYGAGDRSSEQVLWLRKLLRPGSRVLDVGCHEGGLLSKLPNDVKKIGIDIDESTIKRAKLTHPDIDFIAGDFEYARHDGAVDVIMMFHVLEHLPRPLSVLRNLHRMAHRDTGLVIEVPVIERAIAYDVMGFFNVQHMTHFSRTSLRNALVQTGWKIVEEYEPPDYNGYRVHAKPAAPKTGEHGNSRDVEICDKYMASWHETRSSTGTRGSLRDTSRCVIWGGGMHNEFLYHTTGSFQENRLCQYVLIDRDPLKQGKTWRGVRIYDPSILLGLDWKDTVLLISSYGNQASIKKEARELGIPQENIITLYKKFVGY